MSETVKFVHHQTGGVYDQFTYEALQQTKSSVIDLVSGGVGATVSVYIGQPLDTVKVKMQTFPQLYTGMTNCFMKTFRQDGLRGLYAGTLPALAANVAENSILFASYGICQKGVASISNIERIDQLSTIQNAFSGFLAAFFSSLALCPTELIKCRLQAMRELVATNQTQAKIVTPWKLTRSILRNEGMLGMFTGFHSTMLREMPGYFFFFGSYELSRFYFTPEGKTKDDIGPLRTVVSGGIAGTCFWISIFPFDVIKSRVQVQNSKENVFRIIMHICRHEGVLALYNGLTPTILRSIPATGGLFLAYECTKKFLHSLGSS